MAFPLRPPGQAPSSNPCNLVVKSLYPRELERGHDRRSVVAAGRLQRGHRGREML